MSEDRKNKKDKAGEAEVAAVPRHIAIILDGNGRWAKKRGLPRTAGHAVGSENFRKIALYCRDIGVDYLTVYAFSTENWKRPLEEVNSLMKIFRQYLIDSLTNFREDDIKVVFIGDRSAFPSDIIKLIIFLGIGFFFIYWFLIKLEPSQKTAIWNSFTHADYFWVGAVMACCLLSHFVRALRWRLLYGPLGLRPNLNNTFGSVVVAYLANLAFPRLGEVMRCATLRTSDGIPIEKSLGTVVTERVIDVLAFGIVVLIGLLCMYGQAQEWLYNTLAEKSHSLPHLAVIAAVAVVLGIVAIVLYRVMRQRMLKYTPFQKIDTLIMGGIDGLKSIFHLGHGSLALFILYSIIIYMLYILGGLIIFRAIPETAHLGFAAAFVLYLFGSVGMTISQGGLGAYPVLVWQALALYGIGETVGLAIGWLLWASQQAIVIVVGLGYIIYFSLTNKKIKE